MPFLKGMRNPGKFILRAASAAMGLLVVMFFATAAGAGAKDEPTQGPAKFNKSFTHGKVSVDGSTLHYVKGGSGPPLILLHGWPQTWWAWHKVMPDLAKSHTVIAFDLPGLGDSSVPAGGYDKVTTAKRIHEAVGRLGYKSKVDILAHDLGATVAYPYARDFPKDVNRVAFVDMPLPGYGVEKPPLGNGWPFLLNSAPAPITEQIIDDEDVDEYLDFVLTLASLHPDRIDKEAFYKAYADPEKRRAGYEYTRAFAGDATDNKANAEAKPLRMPVMTLGAEAGIQPDLDIADSYRPLAKDVREVIVPDAGHYVPEENPRFLADCANQFFGGPATPGLPSGCNP
jgi:pimeloyl-ACP methyl ester carboxylesterase